MPNDSTKEATSGRPTLCRSCGSIVGAGQQQCAVCGTRVGSTSHRSVETSQKENEAMRFARAVLNRPYKFTIALLVANIFVFILMWQSSGRSFSVLNFFPYEVLVAYGAKVNYLIHEQHQWWRFITPMFIHINLLHLLVNMYSLWVVGPYVEKLYGSAKFVVFWIVTGVAGVVASYFTVLAPNKQLGPLGSFLFKTSDTPSAGASGALFGLVGVLFVFGIKYRHELPEGFRRAFGTGLLPMIGMNLFIGYVGRGFIDNAAHLGGLIAGAFVALLVDYKRPGERSGVAITWHILQITCVALTLFGFVKAGQHFRDSLPEYLSQQKSELEGRQIAVPDEVDNFVAYAKAMNEGQEAFNLALSRDDISAIDGAISNLQSAPQLDPTADELRKQLADYLSRAKAIESETTPDKKLEAKNALTKEYLEWINSYRSWLGTSGRNYGLEEATPSQSPSP